MILVDITQGFGSAVTRHGTKHSHGAADEGVPLRIAVLGNQLAVAQI